MLGALEGTQCIPGRGGGGMAKPLMAGGVGGGQHGSPVSPGTHAPPTRTSGGSDAAGTGGGVWVSYRGRQA